MPLINSVVDCPVQISFRVQQVAGMFDVPLADKCRESFSVEVPGLDEPWQLGVIVGPSGSGKSTIAREAYGDAVIGPQQWADNRAVIDGFGAAPMKRIAHALTAVGFSSPPSWIKPYRVLSNGEQFRVDLARALLADRPLVVFDEFTSVVDRTVARVGSAAVGKAVRKGRLDKRFVAVTCHYDVLEWLEPDWIVDMATCSLNRGRLQRPPIHLRIFRCHHAVWKLFSRHHYLNGRVSTASHCYLITWDEEPVAFCAVLAIPGKKGRWRISRIVVLPDFQGIGIGLTAMNAISAMYHAQHRGMNITTSHPAMIRALQGSPLWAAVRVKKTGFGVQSGARTGALARYTTTSRGRAVVSFQYIGANLRAPTEEQGVGACREG